MKKTTLKTEEHISFQKPMVFKIRGKNYVLLRSARE